MMQGKDITYAVTINSKKIVKILIKYQNIVSTQKYRGEKKLIAHSLNLGPTCLFLDVHPLISYFQNP